MSSENPEYLVKKLIEGMPRLADGTIALTGPVGIGKGHGLEKLASKFEDSVSGRDAGTFKIMGTASELQIPVADEFHKRFQNHQNKPK